MNNVTIWIDNREVRAGAGKTVLQAARDAGVVIPSLCFHPSLRPSGQCRLCAVEIEGYRGLPAACSTEITEGMRIVTGSEKVRDFRREVLELVLKDHPRQCLSCPRNGTCELQQLVSVVGIDFPYEAPTGVRPPPLPGGPYFERDYSLCVHCGRCVRVCHEIRGARAIVFREVKGRQEVGTPFERPLDEVGCQFCGACVDACPVGALRENLSAYNAPAREPMTDTCAALADIVMTLYRKEQPRGLASSLCPICSAGCRLAFELTENNEVVRVRPHPAGPTNRGQACVQGRFALKHLTRREDRLAAPLLRAKKGAMKEASWEDALGAAAKALSACAPGEAVFLTDGRVTNEEAYALQKFARAACASGSVGFALSESALAAGSRLRKRLGFFANTNAADDLKNAACILAVGVNPTATNPIMGTRLRDAVLSGARLIVVNPTEVPIGRYSDVHLRPRPGTEFPVVAALLRAVAAGRGDVPENLAGYDLSTAAEVAGVSEEEMADAACFLSSAKTVSCLYGPGVLESADGGPMVSAMLALCDLKGGVGTPGNGAFLLFGASNLQGCCDMGMIASYLPGQADASDPVPCGALAKAWGTDVLGLPRVHPMETLAAGTAKVAFIARETCADSEWALLAPLLEKVPCVIALDTARPPEGVKIDIALPGRALLEKRGTLTNFERRVQWLKPIFPKPVFARSTIEVVTALAEKMGKPGFAWDGARAVLEEIVRVAPTYAGITPERIAKGTIQWPCPAASHEGSANVAPLRDAPALASIAFPPAPSAPPREAHPAPGHHKTEAPLRAISAEALRPHFFGPLLAKEAVAQIEAAGDILMNGNDAFGMELSTGDTVAVMADGVEVSGTLSVSRLVPGRCVALSAPALAALNAETRAVTVEKR